MQRSWNDLSLKTESSPLVSVVIPACNEEDSIRSCVVGVSGVLRGHGYGYEVIIIDDGSRDGTFSVSAELAKEMSSTRVLRHSENLGVGAAIRTALSAVRGDVIVVMDADLSYSTDCLPRLIREARNFDLVICSPYLKGVRTQGVSLARLLASRGASVVYRIVIGGHLTCYTSMVRGYRANVLRSIHWYSNGFESQAEILAKFIRDKRRIIEIPATLRKRKVGVSKFRIVQESIRHLRLMLYLLTWKGLGASSSERS